MDLPSNMYDTFKDEIWKDLGPLDPNWFEVLSAQTSTDEGTVSDQDDLCANQEGNFSTTLDKAAVESQLFSTPKVFRRTPIVSPQTEDEQSFSAEQESGILPWTATQSPHLFALSKKGVSEGKHGGIQPQSQSSFEILHSPHKSSVNYAKFISESLGAQINPDISWTSSLNTPPAVPSTLILSKKEGSPCPASISAEKNVVFVRKLFPSLSNPPTAGVTSLKNTDIPPVHQGALSPEGEYVESSQPPQDQSDGAWQQKLPDAVEDGVIRRTVSGVLEGAENAPSIFFANSNSTLRKVKPEKVKRKQSVQTKELDSSPDFTSTNSPAWGKDGPTDPRPDGSPSASPVKAAGNGMSQWSPLSLSDIPACTADNNSSTKQSQSNSVAGKPPAKTPASGFIKKKRTFVYTVGPLKSQVQGKGQSQKVDSAPVMPDSGQDMDVLLGKAEVHCSGTEKIVEKQKDVSPKNPVSLQGKVQDLDMSQLCREFAQNFSETSDSEETQSHFSPSACLLAMKQAKQKTRHENLQPRCDGVSDRKHVSLTNHNCSTTDSGFYSTVADITATTASSFIPPCSENRGQQCFKTDIHETSLCTSSNKGFEDVHIDAEANLCSGLRTQLMRRRTVDTGRKPERESGSASTQRPSRASGTVDNINCFPLNGNVHGSLPETTASSQPPVHSTGFKTASNKGIHISPANLERAKRRFEETEYEKTLDRRHTQSDSAIKHPSSRSDNSAKFAVCNSNPLPSLKGCEDVSCQLTASQKADVTELCTLLEEADSQFEFTQFKAEKTKQRFQDDASSTSKAERELDPDFLTDIDFDDSFNSEAEKHLALTGTPGKVTSVEDKSNCGTSNAPRKLSSMSNALKEACSYDPDVPSSSVRMAEGSTCLVSEEPKYIRRVEHTEKREPESENPAMLGVGFKSAGGNVLRVSKEGLSKARALFADLEDRMTDLKPADKQKKEFAAKTKRHAHSFTGKQNLEVPQKHDATSDTTEPVFSSKQVISVRDKDANKDFENSKVCQSGFHMASGKTISISAEYMQLADAFFRDSHIMGYDDGLSVRESKSIEPVAKCIEEQASGYSSCGNVNAALVAQHRKKPHLDDKDMKSVGCNSTLTFENTPSFHGNLFSTSKLVSHPSCTASKDIDFSAIDGLSERDGFCAASGRKVTVSTDSMKRAEYLLNEHYPPENTKEKCNQREGTVTTGQLCAPGQVSLPKTGGFQTSCGKENTTSSAALQKENPPLNECYESQSRMPLHGSTHRNGGFVSASGKPVALSSEALLKAKALFSDISVSADVQAYTKTSDKKQCNAGKTEKVPSRLKTAGDEKVSHNRNAMNENPSEKRNSSDLKPDQMVGVSISEEPGNGRNLDAIKQVKQKGNILLPQKRGFQTASGKGLTISSEAFKKGKALFSDCEDLEDQTRSIQTHFKIPVPSHSFSESKFLEASGKQVAVSSEAVQQPRGFFSDIGLSSNNPVVSEMGMCKKKQGKVEKMEELHCGFTTARGEKVHVSQKNLLKAKNLLKECDESLLTNLTPKIDSSVKFSDMNSKNRMPPNNQKIEQSVITSGGDEKNISELKLDQKGSENLLEEHKNESTEDTNKPMKQKQNAGFQTASGKGVRISSEALKKAKTLLGDCEEVNNQTPSHFKVPVSVPPSRNGGFVAASGKQVTISSEALQSAKALFSDISLSMTAPAVSDTRTNVKKQGRCEKSQEMLFGFTSSGRENADVAGGNLLEETHLANGCIKVPNKQVKHKVSAQNGGFQTASGRGVTVSSEALKKAKTLLNEAEKVEDNIDSTSPLFKVPVPPSRNGGFQAASGKQVSVSSEALQSAKAVFGDIGLSTESSALVSRQMDNKMQNIGENIKGMDFGFSTAGGQKVHVSQKSLLKATNLLKQFVDEGCRDSYSNTPDNTLKLEPFKDKLVQRPSTSSATSSEKILPSNASASSVSTSLTPAHGTHCEKETVESSGGCSYAKYKADTETSQLQDTAGNRLHNHGQQIPCVLDNEGNQTSCSKESPVCGVDESSLLNFQSLHLTGCTKTQQDFLAQEALDCTKALLEDEGLAGQSLSLASEQMPRQESSNCSDGSAVEDRRKGKRAILDENHAGQPPLKRRLLEEFDRTVDSTLRPMKTCPTGELKDRGVFKYSASLRPNITRPHWNGNNDLETKNTTQASNSGEVRPANSELPVFVPRFIKNAKMEACRNLVVKDKTRRPAFVPPFKRTLAQDMSSKIQEEHKHTQFDVFAKPSNSSTFVPPAKKTEVATGVTAIADTTSDTRMNHQGRPVECEPACSDAESSCADDTISTSQDLHQNLQSVELARDMQDMRIRKKKRQTIRPMPGSLFLRKTSGVPRLPLRAAVEGKHPVKYTVKQLYGYGVHEHVSEITSETAESFRFNLLQFIKKETFADGGGVQLGDGGWLIPSNDGTAGKEEFYRAICDTPGVDPKLISEAWVHNHYRWIVWKQASMERSFPETMGGLCLTPEQVLLQLKYRYDVEVDNSRRPALRKIMEKDDTAAKTLILCVCGIVSLGHSSNKQSLSDAKTPQGAEAKVESPLPVVWLTDGWYAIKAQLDEPLTAMLHKGQFAVGCKLIVHGAQLVGSQDACPPLEAPESLMLKICANSCRPARWDVKLGFHKDPRPFLLPVSSLYSNGGPVGCVDIIILRKYPIQWMERKADGGVVFRSGRAEEKEASRFNSSKQKALESLFAKIQAEFEKEENGKSKPQQRRQSVNYQNLSRLQDGEELYEAVGDDPAYLQAHLSEQQLATLQTYRRSVMEKKQAELQDRYRRALEAEDNETCCPKRDVTPVWRLSLADSHSQPGHIYQLSLWRPTSDLQALLKEGCRYKVYNLTTSEGKKRSGVQLTGTKKTQFQDLQASQDLLSARFQPRVSTSFVGLQNPDFQALCGEVDLTGIVVRVIDGQGSSPALYLVDGKLNFVKVRCFSSLSQSGLEDVVKPRVLLALSNLQLRGQSVYPTPVVYAGDLTAFSTNPKEVHLQQSLSELKNQLQRQENFFQTAEEKLSHLISSGGLSSFSSPALQPQTPTPTADKSQDTKTRVTAQRPVRSLGSFTPVSRNPPTATPSTEKDPKSLKRKRALDYLSRVPSPPPLSQLGSVVSPCVQKPFNPPRRSGTPSTLKTVQTPAPKPTESLKANEWVNDEELAMIDTQVLH